MWKSLGDPVVEGLESFWNLPSSGQEGRVWLRLPKVSVPQRISIGWGDSDDTPPTRFQLSEKSLEAYGQIIDFLLPPGLTKPFLGIRFSAESLSLDLHYVLDNCMSFLISPPPSALPVVSYPDAKAPVDVSYDRFMLKQTSEVFSRHSDTQWRGNLIHSSQSFESTVTPDPDVLINQPTLEPSITFVPTDHQGLLGIGQIQNLELQAVEIRMIVSSTLGSHYDDTITLQSGAALNFVTNILSAEYERIFVRVCTVDAARLSLNTYSAYLLEVAPE